MILVFHNLSQFAILLHCNNSVKVHSGKGDLGKNLLKAVDYLDFSVKRCFPQPRPQMPYQSTRRNPSLNVLIALLLLQFRSYGRFGPLPHLTIKFQPLKINYEMREITYMALSRQLSLQKNQSTPQLGSAWMHYCLRGAIFSSQPVIRYNLSISRKESPY